MSWAKKPKFDSKQNEKPCSLFAAPQSFRVDISSRIGHHSCLCNTHSSLQQGHTCLELRSFLLYGLYTFWHFYRRKIKLNLTGSFTRFFIPQRMVQGIAASGRAL